MRNFAEPRLSRSWRIVACRSHARIAPARRARFTADARRPVRVPGGALWSLAQAIPDALATVARKPLAPPRAVVGFPAFTKNAPGVKENPRVIHAAAIQTIRGGQAVNVAAVDGSHYRIQLSYISNTQQTAAAEGSAGAYFQGAGTTAIGLAQPTETPQGRGRSGSTPWPTDRSESSSTAPPRTPS